MTQLVNELVTTKMLPLPASYDVEVASATQPNTEDSSLPIETGIYITDVNGADANDETSIRDYIDPLARRVIHFNRPNMAEVFDKAALLASSCQQDRVLVAACGPTSLIDDAITHCRFKSSKGITFDLHTDVFDY